MFRMGKLVPQKGAYLLGLMVASIAGGLVSAVALASIPDSAGTIHGCYKTSTGMLKVIDSATQTCASGESALNWSQNGGGGMNPQVKDDTGQVVGTLLSSGVHEAGFAADVGAEVYNSQLNRVVFVGIASQDNTSQIIGLPDALNYDIYYQSSDCSGQAYVVSQGPELKTMLLGWPTTSNPSPESYNTISDSAQSQSFTANSELYNGACYNDAQIFGLPKTVSGAYATIPATLPFSLPLSDPLKF